MSIPLLLLGLALVAVVIVDFFGTTLTPRRFHFVAWWLSLAIWRSFVFVSDRTCRPGLREVAGPLIVAGLLAYWIAAAWAAWFLVFLADPGSVVDAATGAPASGLEKLYFVGHILSTLGLGDYRAGGDFWRLTTALMSLAGLTIITLTVTNLFFFVQAQSATRTLAAHLTSLGESGAEILARSWDGAGFGPLVTQLGPLVAELYSHAERAEVSPVTNHFAHMERNRAIAPAVAALDDAVVLLRTVVAPAVRPHDLLLDQICLANRAVVPSHTSEARPPTATAGARPLLAAAGIPLVPPCSAHAVESRDQARRGLLAGWLRETGWVWEPSPRRLTAADLRAEQAGRTREHG